MSEEVGNSIDRGGSMYLRELRLTGFRSCGDVVVPFQPGVTLLVGENNSGKSNVIETLRLATVPLSGRRSRYFEIDDVTRGHDGPVAVTTRFAGLTRFQRAHFIGALELDTGQAVYCTRFRPLNPVSHVTGSRISSQQPRRPIRSPRSETRSIMCTSHR